MRSLFLLVCLLMGCASDTQIVGVIKNQTNDSGEGITSTDSDDITDTDEGVDVVDTGDGVTLEGIVGYTHYFLQQIACPECVGSIQEINVNFSAKFHQPITDSHTSWLPDPGTCVQNLQTTVPSANYIDAGMQLNINGPVHGFIAGKYGNEYYTDNLYETQYDRDGTHTVTSDVLTDGFAFDATRGFDYIEPVEMLYVDMSYAYQAPINRTGTTFYWGPSGSSENFMVIIAVYTSNGSSLIGYTTCMSQDVGYMTVPGSYLSSYPPGSIVAIHLSRQSIKLVPSYELGGYIETHMEWEVIGTGYIQ
jgi:hypothetical protein